MTFKAAKCPNCAGDIQVPDDRDAVKCMYCGSDIIVREAIKAAAGGVNIENLLTLAKHAATIGNADEAYKYYSTVLEHDPQNVTAWIGKGFTAKHGIDEASHLNMCLNNALSFAANKENQRQEIVVILDSLLKRTYSLRAYYKSETIIANALNEIAQKDTAETHLVNGEKLFAYGDRDETKYLMANEHFVKAITLAGDKDATKDRIAQIIFDKFPAIHEHSDNQSYSTESLLRGNQKYLKFWLDYLTSIGREDVSIKIMKHMVSVTGWSIVNHFQGKARLDNSAETRDKVLQMKKTMPLREEFIRRIKDTEKDYEPPENTKEALGRLSIRNEGKVSNNSKCFIATAAYGSPLAFEVEMLRTFRDEYLEGTELGKTFIKYYYLIGPHIARLIDKSQFLRALTRQLLKPIVFMVKRYYRGKMA